MHKKLEKKVFKVHKRKVKGVERERDREQEGVKFCRIRVPSPLVERLLMSTTVKMVQIVCRNLCLCEHIKFIFDKQKKKKNINFFT